MAVSHTHSILIATSEMIEVCRPLKNLDVDFFCYHRVFLDGSEILLSNDANWTQHYYAVSGSMYLDAQHAVAGSFDYFLWPYDHDNSKILGEVREISNIFYGLSFIDTKSEVTGYWEIFGFGLKQQLNINLLLNKIALLRHFCTYFQDQASSLIETHSEYRIIPAQKTLHMFDSPNIKPKNASKHFLKEIGLSPQWSLTSRELECINYLLLGQTASETAKSLNISVRTVETHLYNIKSKLHCTKKSELISHLIKMGFSPSLNLLN